AHENRVASGSVQGVFFVNANLGAGLSFNEVWPHIADARAGTAKGAGDSPMRLAGPDSMILAEFEPAVFDEGAKGPAKVGVLRRRHTELASEGLRFERRVALARHGGENLIFKSGHDESLLERRFIATHFYDMVSGASIGGNANACAT